MYRLVFVFAAVVLVTGCATGPRPYDESQSKAFNIARAGGLVTGIQDVEVDEKAYTALTERGSYQVADAIAAGMSTGIGLSFGQAAGLSLLQSAVAPDSHGARHSLIAWMPASMAESEGDAFEVMIDIAEDSIKQTLDEMGVQHELVLKKKGFISYIFYNEDWSCGEYIPHVSTLDDVCTLKIQLRKPHDSFAETYIRGVDGDAYFFDSSHGFKYNKVELRAPSAKGIPEDQLYTMLSKNLPDWTYLYMPESYVKTHTGETNSLPYFLEEGKQLFFIYPQ